MAMNILIALPRDILGGAEQFLKMVARYHVSKGHTVHIFFINAANAEQWSDMPEQAVLVFGKGNKERQGMGRFIRNISKAGNTQYQYAYTSHTHVTGIVSMMRRMGILKIDKHIGRESTSVFHRFSGMRLLSFRLFYLGYRYLDLLICQTDFMKEQLCAHLQQLERQIKITVQQNPIDIREIALKSSLKTSIPASQQQYIVSAGRLIPEKGFDILIRAFLRVADEYPLLNLMILGEGPLRQQLEELAAELGLGYKVLMPGRVENVYPFFRQAAACVVSSRTEGFPNVLLQMMSQNANVVSTTCAGGLDLLPGISLVPVADEEALTVAIKLVLATTEPQKAERQQLFLDHLHRNDIASYVSRVEQLATS